jgi:hypothetical protein
MEILTDPAAMVSLKEASTLSENPSELVPCDTLPWSFKLGHLYENYEANTWIFEPEF